MTIRRPLVSIQGNTKELPIGDSVPTSSSSTVVSPGVKYKYTGIETGTILSNLQYLVKTRLFLLNSSRILINLGGQLIIL